MNGNSRLLFDVNSTSPTSAVIAVVEGSCVQINAWNLGPNEIAAVERLLIAGGSIPSGGDSCSGPINIAPSQIVAVGPYLPCNVSVEVGQEPNQNITTILLQQPGYYRLQLTPAALGTAIVEAVTLDPDECSAAARQCCCDPEVWWEGTSTSPCLVITPGGNAGHAPVFSLDACCLLQSLTPNPNPVLTDELVFLSGGQCFRATIDEIFSSAIVCDSLAELGVAAPVAGDTIVGLDLGLNCKRMDGETFVEFFETPWTGISTTPALVIAPGGVNGHGPTFSYDLCADIQAQPSCACEPDPGDQVLIVQGGACVLANWPVVDVCDQVQALVASGAPPTPGDEILIVTGGACLRATWPTVDICDQLGLLPNGALIAGDTVLVREAGGACKQVLATAFGGGVAFPLLAPDGSCLAPSYSFTSDPTSGMFYSLLNTSVVVSNNNCEDFIEIGNSVDLNAATSFIRLRGGYTAPGAACGIIVETNAIERLRIGSNGAWNLNTLGGGTPGQAIVSSGFGAPPQWSYPTGIANGLFSLQINAAGEWLIDGASGVAGQAPVSNGPGLPPTWQTPSGVVEPIRQIVYGTGVGVDSDPDFIRDVTNGRINLNADNGGTPTAFATTPAGVLITTGRNTNAVAGSGGTVTILGGNMTNPGIGFGGELDFRGGNGGDGGLVRFYGGDANGVGRPAGTAFIRGGNNVNGVANAGNVGGNVDILAGTGGAGASGGNVVIRAGNQGAGVTPATNNISLSFNGVPGGGTSLSLYANPTTTSLWRGGVGVPTVTKGQDIAIETGGGDPTTLTSDAGDLFLGTGIRGGHPAGTGEYGHIVFYGATTPVGRPLANINATTGDVCLAGSGGPVPGAANTTLPAATTGGFTWLPRIAADPTSIPNGVNWVGGGFSGYANPMTIEQEGGQTCLWVYNFAAAAWHSTCFNAGGAIASIAEPNTQIVYGTGPAVDSSPFFFYDIATGALSLNENAATTRLSLAAPGNVILAAATTTSGIGRSITVAAGDSTDNHGGQVFIKGGDTSEALFLNRVGGNVNITGGSSTGGLQHAGGGVIIRGGAATVASTFGGSVGIYMGAAGGAAGDSAGVIELTRFGSPGGSEGLLIPSRSASFTSLVGMSGGGFTTAGGHLLLSGGSPAPASGGAAGRIDIRLPLPDGAGSREKINFYRGPLGPLGLSLGAITGHGDWVLAGYGDGITSFIPVPAVATSGFAWLPRVAAPPVGVPTGPTLPAVAGWANPMILEETGPTMTLWVYSFSAPGWKSVVLV